MKPLQTTLAALVVASDAERSGASSQLIASFHSHMGLSSNSIYQKLLIFSIWPTEHKLFLFDHIIYFNDEPTQLGPTRSDPTRPGRNAF